MITIKSNILKKTLTFSKPGTGYIFVDLNGNAGSLGNQICKDGNLVGETIFHLGSDDEFKKICKKWLRQYISIFKNTNV